MTESIVPVTGSFISGPDGQAAIWFLGALSQVRVSGDQTGGAFALADHLASRGNASPVHGPAQSRCCPAAFATPTSSPPRPRGFSPCTPVRAVTS
jgi:hypothetical protein